MYMFRGEGGGEWPARVRPISGPQIGFHYATNTIWLISLLPLGRRAAAEAAEARVAVQQPLTADEARAAAAAEGLELVPSSSSETGFKGVSPNGNSYKAHFSEPRAVRAGPRQPVPLRSARTVGCAQVRAAQPHPP